jgi:ribosomal protein L17
MINEGDNLKKENNAKDYDLINNKLINWVLLIYLKLKFFKDLYFQNNLKEDIKQKSSPVFFNLIFNLFLDDLILNIYSITDKTNFTNKSENLTIRQLCCDPRIEQNINKNTEFKKYIDELIKLIKDSNLDIWRNKIIAHKDLKFSLVHDDSIDTTLDKIEEIVDKIKFIVAEYNHYVLKTAIHWDYQFNDYINKDQTAKRICDLLEIGIDHEFNFS